MPAIHQLAELNLLLFLSRNQDCYLKIYELQKFTIILNYQRKKARQKTLKFSSWLRLNAWWYYVIAKELAKLNSCFFWYYKQCQMKINKWRNLLLYLSKPSGTARIRIRIFPCGSGRPNVDPKHCQRLKRTAMEKEHKRGNGKLKRRMRRASAHGPSSKILKL